jgi:phosphate transport system permease protein
MSTQQQAFVQDDEQASASLSRLVRRLHLNNNTAITILVIVAGLVTALFVGIIVKLLFDGIPYLINPDFYSGEGTGSVGQQIFNTFYILILSEIILIPISLAAAIYLMEYAKRGPLLSVIHFAAETLSGIPSIVLGLFGYLFFATVLGFGISRIAGALTLLCLNFPIALRLFEDALASVPNDLREGGLSLGTTKWHTIRTIVLPSALPGIVTAVVLTAGKIIGEAAALIFTMGSTNPLNVFTPDSGIGSDTLTVHIWYLKTSGGGLPEAVANAVCSGSAALLVILLLLINIVARMVGRFIQKRITAA